MKYLIVKDGIIENIIVSDETFAAAIGALPYYDGASIGTAYIPPDPKPTESERLAALEEENTLLKAQVSAQSDQMDFYEDCIAEMAAVVYA